MNSGNSQPASGSPSQATSKIVFDHEQGDGPNLLADHAETSAPVADRPVQTGERTGTESQPATTPATAEVDPTAGVLSYFDEVSGVKPIEPGTKPETEPAPSADAFKAIEANAEKVSAALKQAGLDDKAVEQIINANKLVGRQSTELGELRKAKEQFTASMQVLDPVIERDQNGAPTGFNGVKLLEMATERFGPAEVQKQLASLNLKLVPADYQAGPQSTTSIRESIVREVAKAHGIEGADLDARELRELINSHDESETINAEIDDKFVTSKIQNSQKAQTEAYQSEQQKQQERQTVEAKYNELKAKSPIFSELEPVMQEIYGQYFANGLPSKTDQLSLLHLASIGKTAGAQFKKLMALATPQIEKALLKRLGIPESEVFTGVTQAAPAPVSNKFSPEDSFKELGPALV